MNQSEQPLAVKPLGAKQEDFLPATDGTIDQGHFISTNGEWVDKDCIPDGPLRMIRGKSEYGEQHIIDSGGKRTSKLDRLKKHGYSTLIDASEDVAKNHTHVYAQSESPHYLFVKREAGKNILHVAENRIDRNGHYSIISTYDVKSNYFDEAKGRRLIWERGQRSIPSDSSGSPYNVSATNESGQRNAGATGQIEPQ